MLTAPQKERITETMRIQEKGSLMGVGQTSTSMGAES